MMIMMSVFNIIYGETILEDCGERTGNRVECQSFRRGSEGFA